MTYCLLDEMLSSTALAVSLEYPHIWAFLITSIGTISLLGHHQALRNPLP